MDRFTHDSPATRRNCVGKPCRLSILKLVTSIFASIFGLNCRRYKIGVAVALVGWSLTGVSSAIDTTGLSLSRNEITPQWQYAKWWLDFSFEREPEEFDASDGSAFVRAWKNCDVAARRVNAAWEKALSEDPLLATAIRCTSQFEDTEMQAQKIRQALLRRYGEPKLDQLSDQAQAELTDRQFAWVDTNDERLVDLCLWGWSFLYGDCSDPGIPNHPQRSNSPTRFNWMSEVEFLRDAIEASPPSNQREAREAVIQALQQIQRQAAASPSSDIDPDVVRWAALRSQSDMSEYLGRGYLESRLNEMKEVQEAHQAFVDPFSMMLSLSDEILPAIRQHHLGAVEENQQRTERLLAEATIEPRTRPVRVNAFLVVNALVILSLGLFLWLRSRKEP